MEQNKWFKSTRSGDNGACVEIRSQNDMILMRDSKDATGPVIRFTREEWQAFVTGVRDGQFDM